MSWSNVKVDSIKASSQYSLVGGPFGSNLTSAHYAEEGVPVIRGTNLSGECDFQDDGFVFVSEEKADSFHDSNLYFDSQTSTSRFFQGLVSGVPTR